MNSNNPQRAENPFSDVSSHSEGHLSSFKFKEDINAKLQEEHERLRNIFIGLMEASATKVTSSEKKRRSRGTTKKQPTKKKVSRVKTGASAEAHFVKLMGGRSTKKKAGSQAPDIILHHKEHGRHVGEMKAGHTIDLAQQRVSVNKSGKMHRTTNKLDNTRAGQLMDRIMGRIHKHHGPLPHGTVDRERTRKSTGEVVREKIHAAADKLPGVSRRVSLNWKNVHNLMSSDEAIHIHVHPKTGHTVIVPNKKEHHHLGKKLGLNKTVSFWSLSNSHGKENSGYKLRGFRPKGSSINASFEGSSGHVVDAVRNAGGHVFDSPEHATQHLRRHNWNADTGHAG